MHPLLRVLRRLLAEPTLAKDGECAQTIVHPAISVWAVSTMPNGDIVSGCSDGVVRVFSESEQRWAPAEQIKEYEEHVAKQALPSYVTPIKSLVVKSVRLNEII